MHRVPKKKNTNSHSQHKLFIHSPSSSLRGCHKRGRPFSTCATPQSELASAGALPRRRLWLHLSLIKDHILQCQIFRYLQTSSDHLLSSADFRATSVWLGPGQSATASHSRLSQRPRDASSQKPFLPMLGELNSTDIHRISKFPGDSVDQR